jgi:hypothetical protein
MAEISNTINSKEECLQIVETLYEKYKDNPYILKRIHCHICHYLPNILVNEANKYEKRNNLNSYLSEEQQIFIQVFLSKNNYYYLSNNNTFYEYSNKTYLIVKEDDIIHKLLSTISKDKVLLRWKYKTKTNIIRQIKERNLFNCVPETETIQNVLNSTYCMFQSKNHLKYFLTIIGDNILKKNTDLIFLINSKMRQFLDELDSVAVSSIGINNISNKFVTKYHESHSFTNCRLIKINNNVLNEYWRETLKKIGLDLLCVACHYSNRYSNSDNYLNTKSDEELNNYVYMLKNTGENGLILKFVNEYTEKTQEDFKIEWRDLYFIWKEFLSNNNLPNVIFSHSLKNFLKTLISFDEKTDTFIGITSKYLPVCKDFMLFLRETLSVSESVDFIDELEIDEINTLFRQWSKNKYNLSEENILKILDYFCSVKIVNNKYILNIISNAWNKRNHINDALPFIKNELNTNYKLLLISFDDLYNYYNKFYNYGNNETKLIVSKRYFENYLIYKYPNFILYEKFMKLEWIEHL